MLDLIAITLDLTFNNPAATLQMSPVKNRSAGKPIAIDLKAQAPNPSIATLRTGYVIMKLRNPYSRLNS